MSTDEQIRDAIRQQMVKRKITAAELARRLNVKHQSVTPLLNGERGKIPQSLIDALEALDLELVVQPKRS